MVKKALYCHQENALDVVGFLLHLLGEIQSMARVILDIPKDKMASFLNLIVSLGIDKHAIASNPVPNKKQMLPSLSKFLLFDWEFFNNELEFE